MERGVLYAQRAREQLEFAAVCLSALTRLKRNANFPKNQKFAHFGKTEKLHSDSSRRRQNPQSWQQVNDQKTREI